MGKSIEGAVMRITTLTEYEMVVMNVIDCNNYLVFEGKKVLIKKGYCKNNKEPIYTGLHDDIFTVVLDNRQVIEIYTKNFEKDCVTVTNNDGKMELYHDKGLEAVRLGKSNKIVFKRSA